MSPPITTLSCSPPACMLLSRRCDSGAHTAILIASARSSRTDSYAPTLPARVLLMFTGTGSVCVCVCVLLFENQTFPIFQGHVGSLQQLRVWFLYTGASSVVRGVFIGLALFPDSQIRTTQQGLIAADPS